MEQNRRIFGVKSGLGLISKGHPEIGFERTESHAFAEPDRPALIVHRRATDGGFVREDCTGLDAVVLLPEIGSILPLAEVYEGVEP